MFALKYHNDKKIKEIEKNIQKQNIINQLRAKQLYEIEITNMKLNKRIKYIDPQLYNHNAIEYKWFYELAENNQSNH
jgi:hypothetical protein